MRKEQWISRGTFHARLDEIGVIIDFADNVPNTSRAQAHCASGHMVTFATPGKYVAQLQRSLERTHTYPLYVQATRAPGSRSHIFSSGEICQNAACDRELGERLAEPFLRNGSPSKQWPCVPWSNLCVLAPLR